MPLWTKKTELDLVKLIRKDNPNRPKTFEDLVKEFRNLQPYAGRCTACCTIPWTAERIQRKIRLLINEVDKNKRDKGKLVEPPKKEEPTASSTKNNSSKSKEPKLPETLAEMLKAPLNTPKVSKKKSTKPATERRSSKKTMEGIAHAQAVKAGTATERRKNA